MKLLRFVFLMKSETYVLFQRKKLVVAKIGRVSDLAFLVTVMINTILTIFTILIQENSFDKFCKLKRLLLYYTL